MVVFSFVQIKPPYKIIDIFVDEPIPFKQIYSRKITAEVEKVDIPLICLDHLKILKQKASRAKDLEDIVQLEAIKEART